MSPIVFLDVDGVLIAYPEGEHAPPQFTPRCVDAFRAILAALPRVRVVLSSTWRLPRHVNQLHAQWLEHGFPESLAWDGTPDTRWNPDVSHLHRRGLEIKAWLEAHPNVLRWVVLDDERMAIEPILGSYRCVFTNPARGLTVEDAERAVEILMKSPAQREPDGARDSSRLSDGGLTLLPGFFGQCPLEELKRGCRPL